MPILALVLSAPIKASTSVELAFDRLLLLLIINYTLRYTTMAAGWTNTLNCAHIWEWESQFKVNKGREVKEKNKNERGTLESTVDNLLMTTRSSISISRNINKRGIHFTEPVQIERVHKLQKPSAEDKKEKKKKRNLIRG